MKGKRTNINWQDHNVKYSESDNAKIWTIKKPDTAWDSVIFINSCGIMAVTGDYGNWIFNREFHPEGDKVSECYWLEKLSISSEQTGLVYDQKETFEDIIDAMVELIINNDESVLWEKSKEFINEVTPKIRRECQEFVIDDRLLDDLDDHIWNLEVIKEGLRYYVSCYHQNNEGEHRYEVFAHDNLPESWDHEYVVIARVISPQLKAVFDAYDEIVRRHHEDITKCK